MGRIRVLLVDDSPLALEIMRRMLATAPEIEVVGAVRNGAEALEQLAAARPDVLVTDFHMPRMDGLALTREIMARRPLPILVLSASMQPEQTQNVFQMLEAGAVDVMAKPRGGLQADFGVAAHELARKIRILSGVKVITRRRQAQGASPAGAAPPVRLVPASGAPAIVAIGASTGGPQALETILGALPPGFPVPLVCVQHIAEGFIEGLVDWLASA